MEDDATDETYAFRNWLRHVGELQALFPKAVVLALSATCTNKIKIHVLKSLNMTSENTKFFSVSPNKRNIDNITETEMYWLIDATEVMQGTFANNINLCKIDNRCSKTLHICTF